MIINLKRTSYCVFTKKVLFCLETLTGTYFHKHYTKICPEVAFKPLKKCKKQISSEEMPISIKTLNILDF